MPVYMLHKTRCSHAVESSVSQAHTHRRTPSARLRAPGSGLRAPSESSYPRRPVLYPGPGHLLLVDDVHQLHGVVALHVDHRPLQGILGDLVELRGRRGETGGETGALDSDVPVAKRDSGHSSDSSGLQDTLGSVHFS